MQKMTTAHVAGRVIANAISNGDRTAIIFHDERWTWEAFGRRIGAWAALFNRELTRQQVVLLFLPQTPEAIACYFGAMAANVIPSLMPLPSPKQDTKRYWDNHQQLLALIEPIAIVAPRVHVQAIADICPLGNTRIISFDECPVDVDPTTVTFDENENAVALLQHSSGTTGLKKGVELSHAAIIAQIDSYSEFIGCTTEDTIVSWLPMYHDMGLIACTLMPAMLGQTLVLLDPFEWVSAPASLFDAITAHAGNWVWLPNFAFEHLRRTIQADPRRFDLRTVKAFINCSEPCRAATFDRFLSAFSPLGVHAAQLQVCYAMAETVFSVSQTPPGTPVRRLRVLGERLTAHEIVPAIDGDVQLLSCGPLLKGCTVDINHRIDDGYTSQVLEVGEIVITTPFLFTGYFRRAEITKNLLQNGRYHTRDLGFLYEGELYVLGRKDDLLISNGRNFFAHEIEQIANHVEGVKAGRNVAVGIHNSEIGSTEIWLVQECEDTATITTRLLRRRIREAVQEQLGLILRDVAFVPFGWLVKTTSGKIHRNANQTKLAEYLETRSGPSDKEILS